MALGKCESCELPKILAKLETLRIAAEMASANAQAGDVVLANNPYLKDKNQALRELQENQQEYTRDLLMNGEVFAFQLKNVNTVRNFYKLKVLNLFLLFFMSQKF